MTVLRAAPVLLAVAALATPLAASDLASSIDQRSAEIESKVIEWRRDIHANPELGNREFRTSALVADHLSELGLEVQTGVAHTGVVGLLRGGKPGPVVAVLRSSPSKEKADSLQSEKLFDQLLAVLERSDDSSQSEKLLASLASMKDADSARRVESSQSEKPNWRSQWVADT